MQWPDSVAGQTTFDYYQITKLSQSRRLDVFKETLSQLLDYGVHNYDERYLLFVNALLQRFQIEGKPMVKIWSKMLHR